MIDINIAVYFLDGNLPANSLPFMRSVIDGKDYALSIINRIELLGWQFPEIDKENSAIDFIESSDILPLSNIIADKTIELRKTHKIKLPDAVIAATSLTYDLTLISRNDKDFKAIPLLKYINIFNL